MGISLEASSGRVVTSIAMCFWTSSTGDFAEFRKVAMLEVQSGFFILWWSVRSHVSWAGKKWNSASSSQRLPISPPPPLLHLSKRSTSTKASRSISWRLFDAAPRAKGASLWLTRWPRQGQILLLSTFDSNTWGLLNCKFLPPRFHPINWCSSY